MDDSNKGSAYDPDPSDETVDIDKQLEDEKIYPNTNPENNNTDPVDLAKQVEDAEKAAWEN